MHIEHHRLAGRDAAILPYRAAALIGGEIAPTIVVLHDTASRLERGNCAAYLATSPKVSVHFVVERDGSVQQQVPTNRRAAHAGQSSFHGRQGCNDFSIGIEMVNPGKMTRASETMARTWWGELLSISLFGIEEVETREHGRGLWMPHSDAQIATVLALLEALFRDVPSLTDITTHWYISPGRKVDPNPLFPLEHVRARVLGRDDPAEGAADEGSQPVVPTPGDQQYVAIEVPGDTLNLRRWPSFNPNVIAAIPDEAIVPVLRKGMFDGRLWLKVAYGGLTGWIVAAYAAPITQSQAS